MHVPDQPAADAPRVDSALALRRNSRFWWAAFAVAALFCLAWSGESRAAQEGRPITFEDLLRSESLGDAQFSPDGQLVAFTRVAAASEQPTEGFDDTSLVRSRVFVVPYDGGASVEISGRPGAHYKLAGGQAFAPNSKGILLLETYQDSVGFAYWDARTHEVRSLPGRPEVRFSIYHPPVFAWAGDRLVYPSLPEGTHQTVSHAQTLRRATEIWQRAWHGQDPQVTVSSTSPVFETSGTTKNTLILVNPATGQSSVIAAGNFVSVRPSPDGTRLAAVRLVEPLAHSMDRRGKRGELVVFRLDSTGAELLSVVRDLDVNHANLTWAPSGDRLLVIAKEPEEPRRAARLYEIQASDGSRRELQFGSNLSLANGTGSFGFLPTGWIGTRPAAILARHDEGSEPTTTETTLDYGERRNLRFDLYVVGSGAPQKLTAFAQTSVDSFLAPAGRDFALVVADGGLWRVSADRAPVRASPEGVPVLAFATDGGFSNLRLNTAYHAARNNERVALHVVGTDGKIERRVLDLSGSELMPALAEGEFIAQTRDLNSSLWKVTEGWTSSLVISNTEIRTLATVNPDLKQRTVAAVESFTYRSNGQELTGWYIAPPGADARRPLPAVMFVYGGAVWNEQPIFAQPIAALGADSGQLLAAQGYVVIYPSLPLEAGAESDVMATLADHAVAAADALAAQGVIDPHRVGVIGQSFGGYSVAALLAERSDRFRAGIAIAGIYDWSFSYGMPSLVQVLTDEGNLDPAEMAMIEAGQIRLSKPVWIDPAAYIRNSPLYEVSMINSPLLILQGDLDFGTTGIFGALRMYNAMKRGGKSVTLVRYWGEGHVFNSSWAIKDQWHRMSEWLDYYLVNESQKVVVDQ